MFAAFFVAFVEKKNKTISLFCNRLVVFSILKYMRTDKLSLIRNGNISFNLKLTDITPPLVKPISIL